MGIKLLIFVLLALFNLFILNSVNAKESNGDSHGNQVFVAVDVPQDPPQTLNRNSRSSPNMERTPSMSRTVNQNIPARNPSNERVGEHTDTRNRVNQFIQNNTNINFTNLQDSYYRPGVNTRDNSNFNRVATDVRGLINNRYPNKNNWFNQNFFDSHRFQPAFHNYKVNLWKGATVVDVNRWFNMNNQPYYYYGTGGNWAPNYYDSSPNVYVQPIIVRTQVVDNAENIQDSNWMTLGVFTITKSTESITSPNMFIQLAVSKAGDIAGTYYNTTTNEVYELVGGVEQQSQRAFWKIADNPDSPFVETGIYNLTQNVTPIRVYYQNGEVKDMLLIRVEN